MCILLGMYIVAFFIGFLFWKSCKFWRRLRALDYIWKSGVGFTLFYFTNLFVEILGRKGSGTMIFIVSWCYGGLAMVIFILFWQGSYPPWWHHTGIIYENHMNHVICSIYQLMINLLLYVDWPRLQYSNCNLLANMHTSFSCNFFSTFSESSRIDQYTPEV